MYFHLVSYFQRGFQVSKINSQPNDCHNIKLAKLESLSHHHSEKQETSTKSLHIAVVQDIIT